MISSTFVLFVALFASVVHVGGVPHSNLPPLSKRQNITTDPFALANAQLAQQMNLAALTAQVGGSCPVDGIPSCIGTGVSQCLNNQLLEPQPCGTGTQCVALPDVGQAGTVIACDTVDDAIMRITLAGATGGLTGSDNTTITTPPSSSALASIQGAIPAVPKVPKLISLSPDSSESLASGPTPQQTIATQAQTLNRIFSDLTIGDECDNFGSEYCLSDGSLSLCDNGFLRTSQPCGAGTTCMALPGSNSPVVTCDTIADGTARFADAGVTGGLTGF